MMNSLTVLYDASCGFCCRTRQWIQDQPQRMPITFMPRGCSESERRFPGVIRADRPDEMIVIDDEGGVYRGVDAYLICIWALRRHSKWASRLNTPLLRPLARQWFGWIAMHRRGISEWLQLPPEDQRLANDLRRAHAPRCVTWMDEDATPPDRSGAITLRASD